jgi:kynurenine formamidase
MFEGKRIIDLSVMLDDDAGYEVRPMTIQRKTHADGLIDHTTRFECRQEDLPSGGEGYAVEILSVATHAGTHIDAPWHYGPKSEGKPSKTIEEMPLEYCFGDGVVLDFRRFGDGYVITAADIDEELERIGYKIKPLDIVFIMTGCDKKVEPGYSDANLRFENEYFRQPGLGRESVLHLLGMGVKVIGIDAWGLDTSFPAMQRARQETGDCSGVWQAHYAGVEKEYYHIEKLVNLDQLPPFGFEVICVPIKIKKASAGWSRVLAIV